MSASTLNERSRRPRRRSRKWSLLVVAGLPLVALHAVLLAQRALHIETLDALTVLRWTLAVVLLALLRKVAPRLDEPQSPRILVAALLTFGLIHLPIAAPDPGLPLAATSLGLALTLIAADGMTGARLPGSGLRAWRLLGEGGRSFFVSRDAVRDRAPPQFA